ncbi:MAG: Ig-like domain-containing protein, partial [Chitinophagales bacterium]
MNGLRKVFVLVIALSMLSTMVVPVSYAADPPTVVTYDATNVTETTAVLNGEATANGGLDITEWGFKWGTTYQSNPADYGGKKAFTGLRQKYDPWEFTLGGLAPGTTYYFAAYAANEDSTGKKNYAYATNQKQFTTTSIPDPEVDSVSINPNTNVVIGQSVTISATGSNCTAMAVRVDGTEIGKEYGTSVTCTWDTSSETAGNHTIVVNAYNSDTNKNAETERTVSLVTAGPPTVATYDATNVTQTTAVLNGEATANGGLDITEWGFKWGTAYKSNPEDYGGKKTFTGLREKYDPWEFTLGGLTPGTTYYFVAYAANEDSTGKKTYAFAANQKQFATISIPDPQVDSISISPSSNVVIGQSVTISATGSNCTAMGVKVDGVQLGTAEYGTSITRTWDTSSAASGNHIIVVNAYNSDTNINVESQRTLNLISGETPVPVLSGFPSSDSVLLGETYTFKGKVDGVEITRFTIQLSDNTQLVHEEYSSPQSQIDLSQFSVNTSDATKKLTATGKYTVEVWAATTGIPSPTSPLGTMELTVTNVQRPSISITQPDEGVTYEAGQKVAVEATATDSTGIAAMNCYLYDANGKEIWKNGQVSGSQINVQIPTRGLPTGTYNIKVTAINNASVSNESFKSIKLLSSMIPTVTILKPAEGTTFEIGSKINIKATASDNFGVSLMRAYLYDTSGDEIKKSEQIAGSSLEVEIDTTGVTAGNYYIQVNACDYAGNVSDPQKARKNIIICDPEAPVPVLSGFPSSDSVLLGGTYTFKGKVDGIEITRFTIQLPDNTQLVHEEYSSPQLQIDLSQFSVNTSDATKKLTATGKYTVEVWAATTGIPSPASPLGTMALTVTNAQRPSISITEPAEGATYEAGQKIAVEATATDSTGIAAMNCYLYDANGKEIWKNGQVAGGQINVQIPTRGLPTGTYNIKVTAINNASVSNESFKSIKLLSSMIPTVTILKPAEGTTFEIGSKINVKATASDNFGVSLMRAYLYDTSGDEIKKSEQIAGSSLEVEIDTAGVTAGNYYIQVNACDYAGNVSDPQKARKNLIICDPEAPVPVLSGFPSSDSVVLGGIYAFKGKVEGVEITRFTIQLSDNTQLVHEEYSSPQSQIDLSQFSVNTADTTKKLTTAGKYTVEVWAATTGIPSPASPLGTMELTVTNAQRPSISITKPDEGATYEAGQKIAVEATATDSTGIAAMNCYLYDANGKEIWKNGQVAGGQINVQIPTRGLPTGTYNIKVTALNNAKLSNESFKSIKLLSSMIPTVTILKPAEGTTFEIGSKINVKATGNDNFGVSLMRAYLYDTSGDEIKRSEQVTGSSLEAEIDTAGVMAGNYYIQVNACDYAGNVSNPQKARKNIIICDPEAPVPVLSGFPSSDSVLLGGTYTFKGKVEGVEITRFTIQLPDNTQLIHKEYSTPQSQIDLSQFSVNTADTTKKLTTTGKYTVEVWAATTGIQNPASPLGTMALTVTNAQRPNISITKPDEGATYEAGQKLAVEATATDSTGIAAMNCYLYDANGKEIWKKGQVAGGLINVQIPTLGLPTGTYNIKVTAINNAKLSNESFKKVQLYKRGPNEP